MLCLLVIWLGQHTELRAKLLSLLVKINHFSFTWHNYLNQLFLPSPHTHEGYLTISSGASFQEDDSHGTSVETEYLNNLFIISIQCVCSGIIEEVKLSQRGCTVCP